MDWALEKLTATAVAGRKIIVNVAMAFMDVLSRFAAKAIDCVERASR